MSTDYSEDRLIQKSAAELMETELGWTSVYAYDKEVLFKDDLSKEDIKKLKKVAKGLLGRIKSMPKTMDHPFDKQETKASIVIAIRDLLWQELPESYSDESITYYCDAVFNYISQRYGGVA